MADLNDINNEDLNAISIELNQVKNSNLGKNGEGASDSDLLDADILYKANDGNAKHNGHRHHSNVNVGDGPRMSGISGMSTNVSGLSTNAVINNQQLQLARALSASLQLSQSSLVSPVSSRRDDDIAAIKQELMKSKYRRQLLWKVLLIFILIIHSFCLIYLLFLKTDNCSCNYDDNSVSGSDLDSLNQDNGGTTTTTTEIPTTTATTGICLFSFLLTMDKNLSSLSCFCVLVAVPDIPRLSLSTQQKHH